MHKKNTPIKLFGEINHSSISSVLDNINLCRLQKLDVDLFISSFGGCVSSSESFTQYIKITKLNQAIKRVILLGETASAACDIWLNFPRKKRFIHKSTLVLFHRASSSVEGHSKIFNDHKTYLKNLDNKTIKQLVSETNLNRKQVIKLIEEDIFKPVSYYKKIGLIGEDNIL